jgi:pre-mRNA-splicing factor SYF1
MFEYYIAKATESFGIMTSREIYERAIEALPDKDVRVMSLRYAELERKLGEIDRARAIYGFASQIFDPRVSLFFIFYKVPPKENKKI